MLKNRKLLHFNFEKRLSCVKHDFEIHQHSQRNMLFKYTKQIKKFQKSTDPILMRRKTCPFYKVLVRSRV